jgi:NAD(P)-dependent dehydrogenase (short-subunit alcohol dehydrogenase family)
MLKGKRAVVTGGSRGLGLGVVESLCAEGASVTVVARGQKDLEALKQRLGVHIVVGDVTETRLAESVIAAAQPDLLILNAGCAPPTGRLDQMSWETFSTAWNVDVKAGLAWVQAALKAPLRAGSRVLITSSGAAQNGSPLTGSYAGAKRMLWLMASYANTCAEDKQLGIKFQAIVLQQMVGGTGVGDLGAAAYSKRQNQTPAEFLKRFGPALLPRRYGDHVVEILSQPQHERGTAFGIRGASGVTSLDPAG